VREKGEGRRCVLFEKLKQFALSPALFKV